MLSLPPTGCLFPILAAYCSKVVEDALMSLNAAVAARPGAILTVQNLPIGETGYRLEWLLEEVSTSTNTAAAGGNATLMAIT